MSSTKQKKNEPQGEVFTEFTLTLPHPDKKGEQKPVTVPVVAKMDDLPRAARRRLRNVLTDSATDQMITNGPRYQMGVDYGVAYAASQGVNVNLEGIESDDDYDRVRMELLTAGLRLIGHFAGGAEGKAKPEGDAEAKSN